MQENPKTLNPGDVELEYRNFYNHLTDLRQKVKENELSSIYSKEDVYTMLNTLWEETPHYDKLDFNSAQGIVKLPTEEDKTSNIKGFVTLSLEDLVELVADSSEDAVEMLDNSICPDDMEIEIEAVGGTTRDGHTITTFEASISNSPNGGGEGKRSIRRTLQTLLPHLVHPEDKDNIERTLTAHFGPQGKRVPTKSRTRRR